MVRCVPGDNIKQTVVRPDKPVVVDPGDKRLALTADTRINNAQENTVSWKFADQCGQQIGGSLGIKRTSFARHRAR